MLRPSTQIAEAAHEFTLAESPPPPKAARDSFTSEAVATRCRPGCRSHPRRRHRCRSPQFESAASAPTRSVHHFEVVTRSRAALAAPVVAAVSGARVSDNECDEPAARRESRCPQHDVVGGNTPRVRAVAAHDVEVPTPYEHDMAPVRCAVRRVTAAIRQATLRPVVSAQQVQVSTSREDNGPVRARCRLLAPR